MISFSLNLPKLSSIQLATTLFILVQSTICCEIKAAEFQSSNVTNVEIQPLVKPEKIDPGVIKKVNRSLNNYCVAFKNKYYYENNSNIDATLFPSSLVLDRLLRMRIKIDGVRLTSEVVKRPQHGLLSVGGETTDVIAANRAEKSIISEYYKYVPESTFLGIDTVAFDVFVGNSKFNVSYRIHVVDIEVDSDIAICPD